MKRIELVGGKIESDIGGVSLSVPAVSGSADIPHMARAILEGNELKAFEMLMGLGLGCAGVIIRGPK